MCDQRQLVRIHVWWVTSNIVFVMCLMLCAFASMCVGTRTVQYKAAPRIGMDWRWFRWNPPMLMWNSLLLKFDQSIGRHPRKWNTSSLIKTDKGFGSNCVDQLDKARGGAGLTHQPKFQEPYKFYEPILLFLWFCVCSLLQRHIARIALRVSCQRPIWSDPLRVHLGTLQIGWSRGAT
jgi:hypothetical protein